MKVKQDQVNNKLKFKIFQPLYDIFYELINLRNNKREYCSQSADTIIMAKYCFPVLLGTLSTQYILCTHSQLQRSHRKPGYCSPDTT